MQKHPYKAAALYEDREAAERALRALREAGLEGTVTTLAGPEDEELDPDIEPDGESVRRESVKDLLAGAGAGGVAGVAVAGALGVTGIPLVVAQPLVTTSLAAAYGTALGSVAGGIKALGMDEPRFAALVRDEVAEGRWVLLLHAGQEQERDRALALLEATEGEIETSG